MKLFIPKEQKMFTNETETVSKTELIPVELSEFEYYLYEVIGKFDNYQNVWKLISYVKEEAEAQYKLFETIKK